MNIAGIIGGIGPESTVDYYQTIISKFQERIGSKEVLPELVINSMNMYKIFGLIDTGKKAELIQYIADGVQKLARAGADFAAISGNTPHLVFDQVQEMVDIPIISIVEATAARSKELGLNRIGLIGTKFTMENDFFKKPFISDQKEIVMPNQAEQEYIHRKIVAELEKGYVNEDTKARFIEITQQMVQRDRLQGIILGCTELPMIIKANDLELPVLNTAEIHVNKIVDTIFLKED
ncbi:aspartate/glutamate racemase family protein [Bacillus sp. EB600]|uniref:aspartate/glutamate racemase family protein n=1 Tax=Bacillus sp. EB600 TaxID=2806345 RepID=UPI00210D4EAA|nr:amino acid racemase [Bacillus sp. EB600]MCQ6280798.1 amino acid racemase [Bacillus sp. EB600]